MLSTIAYGHFLFDHPLVFKAYGKNRCQALKSYEYSGTRLLNNWVLMEESVTKASAVFSVRSVPVWLLFLSVRPKCHHSIVLHLALSVVFPIRTTSHHFIALDPHPYLPTLLAHSFIFLVQVSFRMVRQPFGYGFLQGSDHSKDGFVLSFLKSYTLYHLSSLAIINRKFVSKHKRFLWPILLSC